MVLSVPTQPIVLSGSKTANAVCDLIMSPADGDRLDSRLATLMSGDTTLVENQFQPAVSGNCPTDAGRMSTAVNVTGLVGLLETLAS